MKLAPYILERLTSVNRTNGTADLLVPLLRELAKGRPVSRTTLAGILDWPADLWNALDSSDAHPCLQETARETALTGGEALVQVKGNQKNILAGCKGVAAGRAPLFAPAP